MVALQDALSPRFNQVEPAIPSRGRRPRVLIATTLHWAATTRLGLALVKQGFEVGVAAPADHAMHRLQAFQPGFVISSRWGTARAIANAIECWRPALVVPGDEEAIRHLHTVHDEAATGRGRDPRRMGEIIRASLGDPRSFAIARKKSAFAEFAESEGLDTPATIGVDGMEALKERLRQARLPQVVKIDGGFGGLGVRIVRTPAEAACAFAELEALSSWFSTVKRAAKHLSIEPLRDRLLEGQRSITMQEYVEGRPANRAVICWQGEVLAGLSVEALQTNSVTGPATVVRVVDYRGMERAASHAVRRLGLSGFVGFDFVVESGTGRCLLLEMNARPTQTCHLSLGPESDMVGALFAKLAGGAKGDAERRHGCEVIAFFPQEVWRDPESDYLRSAFHDVPWDNPDYIETYAQPVPVSPPTWVDQMKGSWRRLRSGIASPVIGETATGAIPKTMEPGW